MLLEVIVHRSGILVDEGGGGKDKKVSIIGALENNPMPMKENDGMDTLSMVVSIRGRTCSGVPDPFGL